MYGIKQIDINNYILIYQEGIAVTTESDAFIKIQAIKFLRKERNNRLTESDKFLLGDFPLPLNVTIDQIKSYRQLLRDLPEQVVLPNITFPAFPSGGS